jgi:Reverse transcriptase (RNA-dependent DNA polymerase)
LNIIGSSEEIEKTIKVLKNEFKMKNLGVIKLCLGLHIKHLNDDIFVHQLNYIQKILKSFNMNKVHHLITLMVV